LLWGAVMAFLSLLPAVGTALVWGPAAIYLLVTGAMWEGIVLIAFGVLVIGLVDNVLRPILVGKDTKLPDYAVLISTLGGIAIFGINGFVIGPMIAAMFIALGHRGSVEGRVRQNALSAPHAREVSRLPADCDPWTFMPCAACPRVGTEAATVAGGRLPCLNAGRPQTSKSAKSAKSATYRSRLVCRGGWAQAPRNARIASRPMRMKPRCAASIATRPCVRFVSHRANAPSAQRARQTEPWPWHAQSGKAGS
jgi:hypothetical protein